MAAVFVNATSKGADTSATTHTTSKPSGTSTGDLVVVFLVLWSTNSTFPTITPPTGAVAIADVTYGDGVIMNGNYIRSLVWGVVAGAETSYTATLSTAYWGTIGAESWNGADVSDIGGYADNSATVVGTAIPSTAATASAGDGAAHLVNTMFYSSGGTHIPPTSYTEAIDNVAQALNYRESLTGGTETATGGTVSESDGIIATLVIIPVATTGGDQTGSDSGTGSDLSTARYTGQGDLGVVVDLASAEVSGVTSQTGSDSGTGADEIAARAVTITDTGTGTDSGSLPGTTDQTDADIGTGIEISGVLYQGLGEEGTGTDEITARTVQLADSGTGTDNAIVPEAGDKTGTDSGVGIDTVSALASGSIDPGAGADTAGLFEPAAADTGTGGDNGSTVVLGEDKFGTDSGTGTENILTRAITTAELATAAEAIAAFLFTVIDTGDGAEAVVIGGAQVEAIIVGAVTGPATHTPTFAGPTLRRATIGPALRRIVDGADTVVQTYTGPAADPPTFDGPEPSRDTDGPETSRTLTGAGV